VMRARLAGVLGAALLVLATTSIARADEDDPNAWHLAFTPYFWAAGMYGDVTVKGVNAQPDASFLDLLDDTDTLVGLQGHLEVTRGRFGVYGDFFYVRTKVEDAGSTGLDLQTRMWFGEFGIQYRLVDTTIDRVPGITFDLYGGGRYTSLELDLDTRAGPSVNQKVDWIDTGYVKGGIVNDPDYGDAVSFNLDDGRRFALNKDYNLDHPRGMAMHMMR